MRQHIRTIQWVNKITTKKNPKSPMLFLWKTWTHACDTFSLKYPSAKKSGNWQVSTSVCFREMTLLAFHFLSYGFTHCFPAMVFFSWHAMQTNVVPFAYDFSLTFTFPSMICFPEQQGFPLLLCHNNKIKRVDVGCSEPGLLYWVQPPRLGLLLFYIYHLLSCACGKRNKCLLNSYFPSTFLLHFSAALMARKTNIILTAGSY